MTLRVNLSFQLGCVLGFIFNLLEKAAIGSGWNVTTMAETKLTGETAGCMLINEHEKEKRVLLLPLMIYQGEQSSPVR